MFCKEFDKGTDAQICQPCEFNENATRLSASGSGYVITPGIKCDHLVEDGVYQEIDKGE
jgi:hypothetical protein